MLDFIVGAIRSNIILVCILLGLHLDYLMLYDAEVRSCIHELRFGASARAVYFRTLIPIINYREAQYVLHPVWVDIEITSMHHPTGSVFLPLDDFEANLQDLKQIEMAERIQKNYILFSNSIDQKTLWRTAIYMTTDGFSRLYVCKWKPL